jgi:hypothetical protein
MHVSTMRKGQITRTGQEMRDALSQALAEKRRISGWPDAFWESLRIVFLNENLHAD